MVFLEHLPIIKAGIFHSSMANVPQNSEVSKWLESLYAENPCLFALLHSSATINAKDIADKFSDESNHTEIEQEVYVQTLFTTLCILRIVNSQIDANLTEELLS